MFCFIACIYLAVAAPPIDIADLDGFSTAEPDLDSVSASVNGDALLDFSPQPTGGIGSFFKSRPKPPRAPMAKPPLPPPAPAEPIAEPELKKSKLPELFDTVPVEQRMGPPAARILTRDQDEYVEMLHDNWLTQQHEAMKRREQEEAGIPEDKRSVKEKVNDQWEKDMISEPDQYKAYHKKSVMVKGQLDTTAAALDKAFDTADVAREEGMKYGKLLNARASMTAGFQKNLRERVQSNDMVDFLLKQFHVQVQNLAHMMKAVDEEEVSGGIDLSKDALDKAKGLGARYKKEKVNFGMLSALLQKKSADLHEANTQLRQMSDVAHDSIDATQFDVDEVLKSVDNLKKMYTYEEATGELPDLDEGRRYAAQASSDI